MLIKNKAVTVGINLGQKSDTSGKKEEQGCLTEENNSERQTTKPDDSNTSSSNPIAKIPESFAIAKFDYNAQKENDLSFNKGDKIRILRKTETGWWIGLCNNKIGYFPYNFVNVIEDN